MRFGPGLLAAAILVGLGAASPALADKSPFAGLYTTDTLPAGAAELEQWLTWKHGRPGQSYDKLEARSEYEYGVTSDLQLGGYLSFEWSRVRPHGAAAAAEAKFSGVSAEAIYRIWDPYTHPIGVALYIEPAIGPDMRKLEWKLLLQKNFLDDRLVLAANFVLENEWEREAGNWGKKTEFNILAGAAYRFAPNWSGGLEFASQREFDGILPWQSSNAAANSYFLGPTIHYASADYFVTLGVQAQLPWAQNLSGTPGETVGGFAHEEERVRVQLRIGVEL